jgi:hypothetical protein
VPGGSSRVRSERDERLNDRPSCGGDGVENPNVGGGTTNAPLGAGAEMVYWQPMLRLRGAIFEQPPPVAQKNRDDFTAKTKLQIAKRAGWLCSYPACFTPTVGATSDAEGEINIGTAAHICAAAPGGPRYDPNMSIEERASAKNGIWMCRDHGKAIDSADREFTVERLRDWKKQAEQASWRRVLRNDLPPPPPAGVAADTQLAARLRDAVEFDLEVWRRTAKWPSTPVALTLKVDGFGESVTTRALAGGIMSLDDLILVAAPGMGKTTTLFQIAEGVLAQGGIPLVVLLGEWATEGLTVLASILKRAAYRGFSEDDLRAAAAKPGVVLLLDGWNELDAEARRRVGVQVAAFKAELPDLGLVVATRKQTLDVPFVGTRVDLLPLSKEQQVQIATAMRGIKAPIWKSFSVERVCPPSRLARSVSMNQLDCSMLSITTRRLPGKTRSRRWLRSKSTWRLSGRMEYMSAPSIRLKATGSS